MFKSESELHQSIQKFLSETFKNENIIVESEVEGLFGIPDIILAESQDGKINHIIAIELKLSSWQRALKQAFRYRSFAWESYVVLDKKRSDAAASNIDIFKKFNIGLATYSICGEFQILFKPRIKRPYCSGLFQKLCCFISNNSSENINLTVKPCRKFGLGKVFQELPSYSKRLVTT